MLLICTHGDQLDELLTTQSAQFLDQCYFALDDSSDSRLTCTLTAHVLRSGMTRSFSKQLSSVSLTYRLSWGWSKMPEIERLMRQEPINKHRRNTPCCVSSTAFVKDTISAPSRLIGTLHLAAWTCLLISSTSSLGRSVGWLAVSEKH